MFFFFELPYLNSNFALTQGYLNPALNNPALYYNALCIHAQWRVVTVFV